MIAIYTRVSTEEQAVKGSSIESQIEACINKAGTTDVLRYIDDGYSGELLERPGLNKLREDVEKGLIDKVICYDPDRLSRKLMNQLLIDDEFRKKGVELVFVNGEYANTPEGQLFFSMRGAIAEFEKAKIKERTMGGRRQKAKKGIIIKNSGLYGYTYNKEKRTYEINEDEAKIVRMIFDYYTEQRFHGINSLAKHLTKIGVPTKNGAKEWHRQVVRQILMNESYTGRYYQNKWDTEGAYVRKQAGKVGGMKLREKDEWIETKIPAIISEEQFARAQELLKYARRRTESYGRHQYLLSGLVRCGRCGATMNGKKTVRRGKAKYDYVCRKNYAGAKNKGCGRQMSEQKLDHIVWNQVLEWLNDPEELSKYKPSDNKQYIYEEIKQIETEIEKTRKGRKRLLKLASLDEDLELEEIKEQLRELQEKEKILTERYNELQKELNEEQKSDNEMLLKEALEYFLKNKDDITFDKKQYIIRKLIKEIVVVDAETFYIYTY